MWNFEYLCCVILFATCFMLNVQADSEESQDSQDMDNASKICVEESKVDMDTMAKLKSGNFEIGDPNLDKFGFCILRIMELVDEEGKLKKDKLMESTKEENRDTVLEIVENCLEDLEPLTDENSWELFKCYRKERPHEIIF